MKKLLIVIIISVFSILLISCNKEKPTQYKSDFDYFSISLDNFEIIDDSSDEENSTPAKRLNISILIQNNTNLEFINTGYKISLNEEAKPYIASQILEFDQPREITILPKENINKHNNQGMCDENGKIFATGFIANWEPLLASETELKEYHSMSFDDIYNAFKSLTVDIYWDGGEQHEVLEVILEK